MRCARLNKVTKVKGGGGGSMDSFVVKYKDFIINEWTKEASAV